MTQPRPLRPRRAPISKIEWLYFLDNLPDDKTPGDYTGEENLDLYRLETGHDFDAPMKHPIYHESNFDYTEKRWYAVRNEVMAAWIEARPGSRPPAWWRFEALEPRKPRETEAGYLTRMNLWAPGEVKAWKKRISFLGDKFHKWPKPGVPMPEV
jgi:hypothetical protein